MPNATQRSISEDFFKTQRLDLPKPEPNASVQFFKDEALPKTSKTQKFKSVFFQYASQ